MSAASVMENTAPSHDADPGSSPRAALHSIRVAPIPIRMARSLIERYHYLHSLPGGTQIALGIDDLRYT